MDEFELAALGLGASSETDVAELDRMIEKMRAQATTVRPHDPERAAFLVVWAGALCRRAELTNRIDRLAEAEDLLAEAKQLVEGRPHTRIWSLIHELLAFIELRVPRKEDRHRRALDGMRSHLWQVLMQPDPQHAARVARDAAEDAMTKALTCLAANDPTEAIRALEYGRGLALYAAVEMRDIAERLTRLGRRDLAGRWRAVSRPARPGAAPDVPAELRLEIVEALAEALPGGALLDPPGPAAISAALTELDSDALIYLVPASGSTTGFGLAVAATGKLTLFALPNLRVEEHAPVIGLLSRLTRDLGVDDQDGDPDGTRPSDELASSIDGLCDWAWRAAMAPIVERYLPRLRLPPDRTTPHIVLIPLGELARVPWQAARLSGGQPAIHHVGISQAASARMLCHTAAHRPVPPSRLGLVVGDPRTAVAALPGARLEAWAIHETFYRGSRYLGRYPSGDTSASGPATPEQVGAWLRSPGPAGGAMVHLACHAVADPIRHRSYLVLDGGRELAADRLLDLMDDQVDREIGLVVLAACNTGQAITGYDEAYSLGTAFLVAGVRSVLSTQWSIPDTITSVLMYVFHHGVMVERRSPREALRSAQLWMLNPERKVPPDMPLELRLRLQNSDPTHLAGWAGFVHWGR